MTNHNVVNCQLYTLPSGDRNQSVVLFVYGDGRVVTMCGDDRQCHEEIDRVRRQVRGSGGEFRLFEAGEGAS